jgi:hypothetical protein
MLVAVWAKHASRLPVTVVESEQTRGGINASGGGPMTGMLLMKMLMKWKCNRKGESKRYKQDDKRYDEEE